MSEKNEERIKLKLESDNDDREFLEEAKERNYLVTTDEKLSQGTNQQTLTKYIEYSQKPRNSLNSSTSSQILKTPLQTKSAKNFQIPKNPTPPLENTFRYPKDPSAYSNSPKTPKSPHYPNCSPSPNSSTHSLSTPPAFH